MSNKLDEYRDRLDKQTVYDKGFVQGFDAAIALNLPVKFNRWVNSSLWTLINEEDDIWEQRVVSTKVAMGVEIEIKTGQELYKYWIDHIYKPEE